MQSITNAAGYALRKYNNIVKEQVYDKNVLVQNILSNVLKDQGNTTKYFIAHNGRNVSAASGAETMTLPTAGNQGAVQGAVSMKYHFAKIAITDVALKASQKGSEFLANLLNTEYEGAKNDLKRQITRQLYADGTGVVCRVNDAAPDTTLTFDTPMVGKYPTTFFEAGEGILFASDTAGTGSQAYTNVATNGVTGNYTMTVDSATGIVDDDYVFKAVYKGSDTPSVGMYGSTDMIGLKALIDDGSNVDTVESLSRATYPFWNSYVNDSASQRSLTDDLLHTTFIEASQKGTPKFIVTHWDVTKAYGLTLSPDRRYVSSETVLKGGFKGVDFNGIPMVADFDCPYDEAYFIDPTSLSMEELYPMGWLDNDGSVLSRSASTASWEAVLAYYANLAVFAPNKNASLRDVIA